ncbi:MAG: hypothetical protein WC310_04050 [Patescibacteria group bacterium]|jgi:hypothetical protein
MKDDRMFLFILVAVAIIAVCGLMACDSYVSGEGTDDVAASVEDLFINPGVEGIDYIVLSDDSIQVIGRTNGDTAEE